MKKEPVIRRVLASLLIIVGVLCASGAVVSWYGSSLFYDEAAFVETVDALVDEESLRDRLRRGFTEELLDTTRQGTLGSPDQLGVEVDQDDDENEIAKAIREAQADVIGDVVDSVVISPAFGAVYGEALVGVHGDVREAIDEDVTFVTEETGEIFIDMSGLYPEIQADLANYPATQPLSTLELGPTAGRFKIADRTVGYDFMWNWLRLAQGLVPLLIILATGCFLGALLVSDRRPWAIITSGFGVTSVSIVIIVVLYVIRAITPLMVDDRQSSSLVSSVYATLIAPLVRLEIIVAIAGVGAAVVGLIARWVWPDEWIYEHHDDGTGPIAITRRPDAPPLFQHGRSAAPAPMMPTPAATPASKGQSRRLGGFFDRRSDKAASTSPGPMPMAQAPPPPRHPVVPAEERALPSAPAPAAGGNAGGADRVPGWDYEDGSW